MTQAGIIVLEGSDCTGKSTLARELIKANDGQGMILHQGYRWKSRMPTYHLAAVHRAVKLQAAGALVVIDRLWLSEYLYAATFRGGSPWRGYGAQLQRVLSRYGAVYVFCDGGHPGTYRGHLEQLLGDGRRELYPDLNGLVQVNEGFRRIYKSGSLEPALIWRWHHKHPSTRMFAHEVLQVLRSRREAIQETGLSLEEEQTQVVGNVVDSTVVFIGERPNCKNRALHWPWVDMTKNATSHLTEHLFEVGLAEKECAFSNVLTYDCKFNEELVKLVSHGYRHKHPRYVLLGKVAQVHAPNYYVIPEDHSFYMNHPQWFRRFDHHGDKLKTALKEALYV